VRPYNLWLGIKGLRKEPGEEVKKKKDGNEKGKHLLDCCFVNFINNLYKRLGA
jgi:threonine/homoserine/homoserine lactone efflux protein